MKQVGIEQGDVISIIGEAAVWEQLAEECTELAKAALKMARKLRLENPTPLTMAEIQENVVEEWGDVLNCVWELNVKNDYKQQDAKMERWISRLKNE